MTKPERPDKVAGTKARDRWLAPALLGLGFVAVAGQLASRPSPDVAWNLYMARELLRGQRLGVDLLENTPPMIFVLKMPVVAVAGLLKVREWPAWVAVVTCLAGLTIALTVRLTADWHMKGIRKSTVAGVISVALLLLPSGDFGQRDHMMVILVLPYVFLITLRVSGAVVSKRLAVFVGALAGVGIGIKPHFVLLPAAVTLFLGYRKRMSAILEPEHLVIGTVGVAYVTGVWLLTPEYLRYAATYGPLYQRFQTDFFLVGERVLSTPSWAGAAAGIAAVPAYTALGLFVAVRKYLTDEERGVVDVLAIATMALLLVGVIQGKGWWYHFLPAATLAVLTICLVLVCSVKRSPGILARVYLGLGAGVLAAMLGSVAPASALRVAHPHDGRLDADPNFPLLLPLVRAVGPRGHVAILSTNISSSFPLVLEGGARWAFRQPNFWPLVAFYRDEVRGTSLVVPRQFADRSPLEQQFTRDAVDDVLRTEPDLMLVLRPDTTVRAWGGARRFDYLGYFSLFPGFRDGVLQHYQSDGVVGDYTVYWRREYASAAQRPVSAPLGRVRRVSLASLAELLSAVAFLAGFVGAWRVTRGKVSAT